MTTRTTSKTVYTPLAKKLLATLPPAAAVAALQAAQVALLDEGAESTIPMSLLLTDEQRRAHRALRARKRKHLRRAEQGAQLFG